MDSLKAFLYPQREENKKFILSEAFKDESGKPIEWEMKQLMSDEAAAIGRKNKNCDTGELFLITIAESIVYPDLRNKELLEGLSEIKGRKIMSPKDALLAMVSNAEINRLMEIYNEVSAVDFKKK